MTHTSRRSALRLVAGSVLAAVATPALAAGETIPFAFSVGAFDVAGIITVGSTAGETRAEGVVTSAGIPAGRFWLNGAHWVAETTPVLIGPVPTQCCLQMDVNQRFIDVGIATFTPNKNFSGWQRAVNF